ncbi:MAG: inverse autotransporter beta domain-containing protein [Alphaproteobacteria bacterium]|nr:inverse autotransporter beta domain-containing protein [Alphaproteobacteria bacterium]
MIFNQRMVINQFRKILFLTAASLSIGAVESQGGPSSKDQKPAAAVLSKKWNPAVHFGAKAGNERRIGQMALFAPLSQGLNDLIYLDFRFTADSHSAKEGNFGIGKRWITDSNQFILGVYGFYDRRKTELSNTVNQLTLGAEAMSETWDYRANVYLPEDTTKEAEKNIAPISTRETKYRGHTETKTVSTVNSKLVKEIPLKGFDLEVGRSMPGCPPLRVYGAVYDFEGRAGAKSIRGLRLRANLDINEYVSFQVEGSRDTVRKAVGFVGASVRIPFGGSDKKNAPVLNVLDKRMTELPMRDIDIVVNSVEGQSKREPLIEKIETGNVWHIKDPNPGKEDLGVNDGLRGDGTAEDPFRAYPSRRDLIATRLEGAEANKVVSIGRDLQIKGEPLDLREHRAEGGLIRELLEEVLRTHHQAAHHNAAAQQAADAERVRLENERLAGLEAERVRLEANAKRQQDEANAKRQQDEANAKRQQDEANAKRQQDEANAKRQQEEADAKRQQEEADANPVAADNGLQLPPVDAVAQQRPQMPVGLMAGIHASRQADAPDVNIPVDVPVAVVVDSGDLASRLRVIEHKNRPGLPSVGMLNMSPPVEPTSTTASAALRPSSPPLVPTDIPTIPVMSGPPIAVMSGPPMGVMSGPPTGTVIPNTSSSKIAVASKPLSSNPENDTKASIAASSSSLGSNAQPSFLDSIAKGVTLKKIPTAAEREKETKATVAKGGGSMADLLASNLLDRFKKSRGGNDSDNEPSAFDEDSPAPQTRNTVTQKASVSSASTKPIAAVIPDNVAEEKVDRLLKEEVIATKDNTSAVQSRADKMRALKASQQQKSKEIKSLSAATSSVSLVQTPSTRISASSVSTQPHSTSPIQKDDVPALSVRERLSRIEANNKANMASQQSRVIPMTPLRRPSASVATVTELSPSPAKPNKSSAAVASD